MLRETAAVINVPKVALLFVHYYAFNFSLLSCRAASGTSTYFSSKVTQNGPAVHLLYYETWEMRLEDSRRIYQNLGLRSTVRCTVHGAQYYTGHTEISVYHIQDINFCEKHHFRAQFSNLALVFLPVAIFRLDAGNR